MMTRIFSSRFFYSPWSRNLVDDGRWTILCTRMYYVSAKVSLSSSAMFWCCACGIFFKALNRRKIRIIIRRTVFVLHHKMRGNVRLGVVSCVCVCNLKLVLAPCVCRQQLPTKYTEPRVLCTLLTNLEEGWWRRENKERRCGGKVGFHLGLF